MFALSIRESVQDTYRNWRDSGVSSCSWRLMRAWCPEKTEEEESIEHVLCRFSATAAAGVNKWSDKVKEEMLLEEPEMYY